MSYGIEFTAPSGRHLKEWRRSGQTKILTKIAALPEELHGHPTTGTGHVERLKGNYSVYWSRGIDKESRLIYIIEDDRVVITVMSLKGHYGDK